jgi:hypothetical protein
VCSYVCCLFAWVELPVAPCLITSRETRSKWSSVNLTNETITTTLVIVCKKEYVEEQHDHNKVNQDGSDDEGNDGEKAHAFISLSACTCTYTCMHARFIHVFLCLVAVHRAVLCEHVCELTCTIDACLCRVGQQQQWASSAEQGIPDQEHHDDDDNDNDNDDDDDDDDDDYEEELDEQEKLNIGM